MDKLYLSDPFIRDRGNIKWSSMMLPEHRKALMNMEKAVHDVAEPVYDEDQLAELSDLISRAIHEKSTVFIEYYKDNRACSIVGTILKYEGALQAVKVTTEGGDLLIPVKHVIRVEEE